MSKQQFRFNDKVRIKDGFFKGMTGTLVDISSGTERYFVQLDVNSPYSKSAIEEGSNLELITSPLLRGD